jgi:DNA-directed RNA polymerase subunit H (RpoH/RPB5)
MVSATDKCVIATCDDMMSRARGYTSVGSMDKDTLSSTSRKSVWQKQGCNDVIMLNVSQDMNSDKITSTVKKYAAGYRHVILICNAIAQRKAGGCSNIELFTADEMLFNPLEHPLVPKHEVLDANNRRKLEAELGEEGSISKLPSIRATDPVARFYGIRKDDIVKISRYINPVYDTDDERAYVHMYRLCI